MRRETVEGGVTVMIISQLGKVQLLSCEFSSFRWLRLKVRFTLKQLDAVDSSIHPICDWFE